MQRRIYSVCLVCFALFLATLSCKKSESLQHDLYGSSPATAIPAEINGGLWFWGSIGPISYYDRDGHQVGNATEAAREYRFAEVNGKGRFEFTQYLGMRNAGNCVTEIYTTKKGTITFEGTDKLTLYPVEGRFRTVKKGCSNNGSTERMATTDELKQETYLWETKIFAGKTLLYIYEANDALKLDPVFVYSYAQ
ncbi:hypothetical protein [Niabella sp.]|uniref:hypothetical protein n=1 Tax=Niabella sp. TaxID=1962976 RepID=UPI00261536FB|nr:hypothetical protein [Niabella sp.]